MFQLNNNEEKPNHLDTHMELQCLDTDEESTSSTYHPSPNQKAIFNAFDEEEEV